MTFLGFYGVGMDNEPYAPSALVREIFFSYSFPLNSLWYMFHTNTICILSLQPQIGYWTHVNTLRSVFRENQCWLTPAVSCISIASIIWLKTYCWCCFHGCLPFHSIIFQEFKRCLHTDCRSLTKSILQILHKKVLTFWLTELYSLFISPCAKKKSNTIVA